MSMEVELFRVGISVTNDCFDIIWGSRQINVVMILLSGSMLNGGNMWVYNKFYIG